MTATSQTLEQFVESSLQSRLERLSSNLEKAEKHPEDADHIHDLRVAIRRYTQGLRIFKHLLNRGGVRKMRRRLRTIMDLCGAIRNCDIALEVLHAAGARIPVLLTGRIAKTRSHAERDLGDLLKDANILKKTKVWEGWLRAKASSNQSINSTARRILIPLTKEFLDAGVDAASPTSTPMEMHQFRLKGKRIRYSMEIFGTLAGFDSETWIAKVRELQEHLGAINDCATTRDLIAEPNGPSPEVLFAESAVDKLLNERIQAFREYWNSNLPPADRRLWLTQVRNIGRNE